MIDQKYEMGGRTYIQRQVQTNHITLPQQLLKRQVLRTRAQLRAQFPAVMVNDLHPKRLGLGLQVAAYPAHAQDTEDFLLRVVAQAREWFPAPVSLAEGVHAVVEVPEGAEDKEHVDVGCCVVDCGGGIGDAERRGAFAAGGCVDLVVAGSCGIVSSLYLVDACL